MVLVTTKQKMKTKWVGSYTLKGQHKDLSFVCMTKLHQLKLGYFDARFYLPAFSSARETFSFISNDVWSP